MGDAYKYNSEGVSMVINTLNNLTQNYKEKILELTNLINNINTSSSWKDVDVKTAFINTCNSYIKIYNNLIKTMEAYIKYLKNKSIMAERIEQAFMGGK